MKIVKNAQAPSGVNRALFRAPIYIYRLGLGWLFGKRVLLLNVVHNPHISIQVGRRTIPVTAVPLTTEGADIFAHYAIRHRAAAKCLLPRLMGFSVDGTEADFPAVGQRMRFVRLASQD